MIIIGEKINGTRKAVAKSILERDKDFIQNLTREQVEGGSSYLDVNAGTAPEREPDDMVWLVDTIQEVTDLPLCLDSANPKAIEAGLAHVNKVPLINSVSGEKPRIDNILPLALEHKTGLILLALDDDQGIPDTCTGRMKIVDHLVGLALNGGLLEEQLFIDPLVTAISTGTDNATVTYETIKAIKSSYPKAYVTCGLSNISFGMPLRSLINKHFATMAIQAGLDSAIINPNNRELKEAIMASELLMGQDRHCLNFNRAYRANTIGPVNA
ncbi:MAG: dihydropteroate synthase [Desulfobacterales bacterium]|nr:dihydropteroate synthase [Desulfobacterales bacterium]